MLLILFSLFSSLTATRIDGTVNIESDKLTYITDFCYGSEGGILEYNVVTDLASGLVIYSAENWNYIQSNNCNCSCKQYYTLDSMVHFLVPGGTGDTGQITISTPNQKPGYIYAAFLTCAEGTKVNYHLHFTRNVPNSAWPELPYDAVGLLETYAISTAIALGIGLVLLCNYSWWSQKHWYLTPPPVKIFGLACILWLASSACILTHFLIFAHDGYGVANVEGFGRVADVLSRLVFMGLLLALARGWNIVPDSIHQDVLNTTNNNNKMNTSSSSNGFFSKVRLSSTKGNIAFRRRCGGIFLIGSLGAIYIIMAVWYLVERSPGDVTYVYDSVPGITVSVVQAITGLWFAFDSFSTISILNQIIISRTSTGNTGITTSSSYTYNSSTITSPYIQMQITWLKTSVRLFIIYFAALPIAILIGILALPNYDDEKTVEVTLQSSRMIFYGCLLYLFAPSRTDRLFSTWQPENSVVKLLRPEISSVDLLTPVLSGYASPGGFPNNFAGNGGNRNPNRRLYGPGSGYASGNRTPKQRTGIMNSISNPNNGNMKRYGTSTINEKGNNGIIGSNKGLLTTPGVELPHIHEETDEHEQQALLSNKETIGTNTLVQIPSTQENIINIEEQQRLEEREERKRKKLAKKEKKKEKERQEQRKNSSAIEEENINTELSSNILTNNEGITTIRIRGHSVMSSNIEDTIRSTNPQAVLHDVLEQDFFRESVSPTKERTRTMSNVRRRTESGNLGLSRRDE